MFKKQISSRKMLGAVLPCFTSGYKCPGALTKRIVCSRQDTALGREGGGKGARGTAQYIDFKKNVNDDILQ